MDRCGGFNPTRNREVSLQEIGSQRTPPDPCPMEKMGVSRKFDPRSIRFPLFNCSYFHSLDHSFPVYHLLFHLIRKKLGAVVLSLVSSLIIISHNMFSPW